jgi:hypothetical protein
MKFTSIQSNDKGSGFEPFVQFKSSRTARPYLKSKARKSEAIMNRAYTEKLKNPKWQRKKTEILMRDDFICRRCGDTESSLHVHHTYYTWGIEPWDYENSSLLTLCETCHSWETDNLKNEKKEFIDAFCKKGFTANEFLFVWQNLMGSTVDASAEELARVLSYVLTDEKTFKLVNSLKAKKRGKIV